MMPRYYHQPSPVEAEPVSWVNLAAARYLAEQHGYSLETLRIRSGVPEFRLVRTADLPHSHLVDQFHRFHEASATIAQAEPALLVYDYATQELRVWDRSEFEAVHRLQEDT